MTHITSSGCPFHIHLIPGKILDVLDVSNLPEALQKAKLEFIKNFESELVRIIRTIRLFE